MRSYLKNTISIFLVLLVVLSQAISKPTAASNTFVLGNVFITDTTLENKFVRGEIWSGMFSSYDGRARDASRFFKPKSEQFYLNTKLGLASAQGASWLNIYFDNGYVSDLLIVKPIVSLGFGSIFKQGNHAFSFNMNHILSFEGWTEERPCYDQFKRKFHCGTGLAWTESKSYHLNHDLKPTLQLKYSIKF